MSQSFDRIEIKYLLDQERYQSILELIRPQIKEDAYPYARIMSLYYDTSDFRLIRRSIEKPDFKEKLRVRSYGEPKDDDPVFVELKRKLDGVVYKRRTKATYKEVLKDIRDADFEDVQVGKEIRAALNMYGDLRPMVFVGCERYSYVSKDDPKLRITFDENMRYRMKHFSLNYDPSDKKITDGIVMEIKAEQAMPLWLSAVLDKTGAYPRGFSKVGQAFLNEIGGK